MYAPALDSNPSTVSPRSNYFPPNILTNIFPIENILETESSHDSTRSLETEEQLVSRHRIDTAIQLVAQPVSQEHNLCRDGAATLRLEGERRRGVHVSTQATNRQLSSRWIRAPPLLRPAAFPSFPPTLPWPIRQAPRSCEPPLRVSTNRAYNAPLLRSRKKRLLPFRRRSIRLSRTFFGSVYNLPIEPLLNLFEQSQKFLKK